MLSVLVSVVFIRVVTNTRIYAAPTPPQVAAIEEIRAQPQCWMIVPGRDHLECVLKLCRLLFGKLVADAQYGPLQSQKAARELPRP